MAITVNSSKQTIRSVLRARRGALNTESVEAATRAITDRVLEYFETLPRSEWVLAYAGGRENEVPTLDLLDALVDHDRVVLLPKPIPGPERKMRWANYTGRDSLIPGAYEIPEPPEDAVIDGPLPRTAPVLVPGIAFDPSGTRLGFGVGYYDRFLAEHDGLRVAPAYDFQVVERIQREPHDIPMDVIITEERLIRCRASQLQ
jgi:5-formyltetrahydrofolate cyclo-ligase